MLALAGLAVQRDVLRRREDRRVFRERARLASDFNYPHIFSRRGGDDEEAKEGFLVLVCCYTTNVFLDRRAISLLE